MLRKSLMVHPDDTVAMVLEDADAGDTIETPKGTVTLLEPVPFAHKVAVIGRKKGEAVIKYGEEIGCLLADAPAGAWIHSHNMGCDRGKQ